MSITLTPVCGYCTAAATRVHRDATDELLCTSCARQQCDDWRSATRPITAADVRRYNDGIGDTAAELPCRLFALCDRPAVGTATLPFGDVHGCQRCADRLELTLVPFTGAAS